MNERTTMDLRTFQKNFFGFAEIFLKRRKSGLFLAIKKEKIKMKIIYDSSQLEFTNEYDSEIDVNYQGIPFTGLLSEELEKIEYLNGDACHIEKYYENGTKWLDEYRKDRQQVKSLGWYENGQLEHEFDFDSFYFNEPGIVLVTGHSYYITGEIKSKADNGVRQFFSIDGTLIGETKSTPHESYFREYYLNGQVKYYSEIRNYYSEHFATNGGKVIEESSIPGEFETTYFTDVIESQINQLFIKESELYQFESSGDKIRENRLLTWLTSKVRNESHKKYLDLNFILCFNDDKKVAQSALNRITNFGSTNLLFELPPKIEGVSEEEIRLKLNEISQSLK